MRRAATTFAMLALLAMIVVPVAAANKPTREFVPAPSEFTLDASICGFDVLVEVLTNKQYAITFSNGMTTVAGALKVRVTNLDDPTQSVVLNIPGPGFFDESGVLTATGPWFFFFFPGDLGPGSPVFSPTPSAWSGSTKADSIYSQGGRLTSARSLREHRDEQWGGEGTGAASPQCQIACN
jgi:hypothetical protein